MHYGGYCQLLSACKYIVSYRFEHLFDAYFLSDISPQNQLNLIYPVIEVIARQS